MQSFKEAALPQPLFHRLEQIGFTTPTPIQVQSIPHILEGKDVLGSAQTGTGKTGAYGIPLVARLLTEKRGSALILLPTRELAMQVLKALEQFIGRSKVACALLIGGDSMDKQNRQLRVKPRLIVGTPGRVNDHLKRGSLMLHDTNFLVLDEVDRMLDMGFGIQLDEIARYLTAPERQTLMFSATLPTNIEKVAAKYLTNPVRVSVGSTRAPAENVKQVHVKVEDSNKYTQLLQELDEREGSVVVFVKTKGLADRLAKRLCNDGHKANALHGDLRQSRRSQVTAEFRKKKYRILVATDVAARGLDVPHIEHVINHDLPSNPEDYIHRIGRTARAGAEGEAVNFLSSSDNVKWRAIQLLLDPDAKVEKISGGAKRRKKKKPKAKSPVQQAAPVKKKKPVVQEVKEVSDKNEFKKKRKKPFVKDAKKASDEGGFKKKRKKPFGKDTKRTSDEDGFKRKRKKPFAKDAKKVSDEGGFKRKSKKPFAKDAKKASDEDGFKRKPKSHKYKETSAVSAKKRSKKKDRGDDGFSSEGGNAPRSKKKAKPKSSTQSTRPWKRKRQKKVA